MAESMISSNGINLAYDTFGDSGMPPVLLIMGLSAQMVLWEDEFCTRIADRGFYVVRFDNRDVGRSTSLDNLGVPDFRAMFNGQVSVLPYSLGDMAKDTVGLLDALHISSAHIVGASMGGMIAQIIAMNDPARMKTLTAIMSSTGNPLLPPPRPEVASFLMRPFPVRREQYIEHFVTMWKILNTDGLPFEDARLLELAVRTYERGFSASGSARQLAAILLSGSRKEGLMKVNVLTLVIHGDRDPLLPLECGIDIAQSIPGAAMKVIQGMGHALPPCIWDDIIDAFVLHARTHG